MVYDRIRSALIPSSKAALLSAQNALLKALCGEVEFIGTKGSNGMNYVVFKNPGKASFSTGMPRTLVMMHGYGSGLGFFFSNVAALSGMFDSVICIDWLGMGGSDRPNLLTFSARDKTPRLSFASIFYSMVSTNWERKQLNDELTVQSSVDFFTDSLHELLEGELKLPEYTLAGHSLGGWLAARYAAKYDQRTNGLILISPVGVCQIPESAKTMEKSRGDVSLGLRALKLFWETNGTPQQLLRAAGSFGPNMVRHTLNRRFGGRWSEQHLDLIANYFYQISAEPASGEYALNSLLAPMVYFKEDKMRVGIFAKQPLEGDKTFEESNFFKEGKPVLLFYGDHDWLRFDDVQTLVHKWQGKNGNITYQLVNDAGHHLYLDNGDLFHETIQKFVVDKL